MHSEPPPRAAARAATSASDLDAEPHRRAEWSAPALLVLQPGSAAAQSHDGAIGYGAGGAWFDSFAPATPAPELGLDPGWVLTVHLDRWLDGGRLGGRLGGSYSRRPLDGAADWKSVDLWALSASALLRALPPEPERRVAPFLALGLGVVDYDLGEGSEVLTPDGEPAYRVGDERQLARVLGVGVDVFPRLAWREVPVGLRLELADLVTHRSPVETADGHRFGSVHNVTLTLGVHGIFGVR